MIFLITKVPTAPGTPAFEWTLHRKAKGDVGEALARSCVRYATEAQCRSAIATAKKAMAGVRFAATRTVYAK